MSAWLSPRIRLGVMASVTVVIVWALLLTPSGSEGDHPPDSPLPSTASGAPIATAPPASRPSSTFALSQSVLDTLTPVSAESLANGSWTDLTGSTYASEADPDPWSSGLEVALLDLGPLSLVDQEILPPPGCLDCEMAPGLRAGLALFGRIPGGVSGGGGGGGGGAASGGGSSGGVSSLLSETGAIGDLTQSGSLHRPGLSLGDGPGSSASHGNSFSPSPNGNGAPGPQVTEAVSVPEPSTLTLISVGAVSLMVKARRTRKRRG